MNNSKQMVDQLRVVAAKLKKASKWHGSDLDIDAEKDSYVFELACYFRVAVSASITYKVEVTGQIEKSKTGVAIARWPRAPANKSNFSYLNLIDPSKEEIAYQLCPGINILDIDGKDRAPDISLLQGATPDKPAYDHLFGIWDAKHTNDEKSRLADTEVSDFAFTFWQLGKPRCPQDWITSIGEKAFQQSGLVTNGKESTEPDSTLKRNMISETSSYPQNPKTRP